MRTFPRAGRSCAALSVIVVPRALRMHGRSAARCRWEPAGPPHRVPRGSRSPGAGRELFRKGSLGAGHVQP
eukprot:6099666-Alexandrium_andersonii.AAC.1